MSHATIPDDLPTVTYMLKVHGFGYVRHGSYSGHGTDVGGAFCFSIAPCFRVVVMGVPLPIMTYPCGVVGYITNVGGTFGLA